MWMLTVCVGVSEGADLPRDCVTENLGQLLKRETHCAHTHTHTVGFEHPLLLVNFFGPTHPAAP